MLISELARADIAILGAGREGLSVVRFLRRHLPEKSLTLYAETEVSADHRRQLDPGRDTLVIGSLHEAPLGRHQVLVRSPGISPYRSELQAARAAGVRFTTASSLWFAAHEKAKTICVTGTKGKSTTAALITHLLRAGGSRVEMGGNMGRPLLDCDETGVDWWVVELSSYQLSDLEGHPSIGVILNLSDEHLDWHGGSERYRRDKLRLAELLQDNPLVVDLGDAALGEHLADYPAAHTFGCTGRFQVRPGEIRRDGEALTGSMPPSLRGAHNLHNLAAALTAAGLADGDLPDPLSALSDFQGLPHRQQQLGLDGGLLWVDDSLATTPVATLAALAAFDEPVTLLLGGLDRGIDWSGPISRMKGDTLPHAIISLPDSGPVLAALMRADGLSPPGGIHEAGNLAEAVSIARQVSAPGGIVLLSPGAPSFPHFRDFADRGEQFAELALNKRDRGQG